MPREDQEVPAEELELLIAEQVMGWVRNRYDKLWPDRSSFGYRNSRGHGMVPAYSQDMGLAWTVIERLRERRIRLESLSNRPGDYVCTLVKLGSKRSDGTLYTARSHTPALAICMAALKALPVMRRQASVARDVETAEKKSAVKSESKAAKKSAKKTGAGPGAKSKTKAAGNAPAAPKKAEPKLKSGRSRKKTRFSY